MISEGAEVKGEIKVKNDIRIAGYLEGDLITKGKAIVTSSGHVNGNIRGVFADVAGTVDGEIRVSDKMVIRKSAVITGTVYTKTLLVEEGAKFDGKLQMSSDEDGQTKSSSDKGDAIKSKQSKSTVDGQDAKKVSDNSESAKA